MLQQSYIERRGPHGRILSSGTSVGSTSLLGASLAFAGLGAELLPPYGMGGPELLRGRALDAF